MIQAITQTDLRFKIQTEDNRINTSVAKTNIRHLIKFTNDMDKSIQYAYAVAEGIEDRYTEFRFSYHATPNLYTGKIKFLPAGYWKYECYEVSWVDSVVITEGYAPANENDVLEPAADDKGIVQGLVTKGKMYVDDKAGTGQVQYTQRQEPSSNNYIYYGQ
tara:strand:- start:95 stop:577 length:483 start_codon:yes stop_codon:yes gene_type:complete